MNFNATKGLLMKVTFKVCSQNTLPMFCTLIKTSILERTLSFEKNQCDFSFIAKSRRSRMVQNPSALRNNTQVLIFLRKGI